MFGTDMLTFQEFMMQERLPLATIQNAILHFLRNRDDVVVFGAQAVNAYVGEPRMTQDIDLLSPRAEEFAEELRTYLSQQFHIAVRIRKVNAGRGYRLYQVQKSGNRHLVDLRAVKKLPKAQRIEQVLIMAPAELIASKVVSYAQRRGKPKAGTDWRDVAMLLLKFPELKSDTSAVMDSLVAAGASPAVIAVWQEIVATEIEGDDDDDDEFWQNED
jgi:hypothetical protein